MLVNLYKSKTPIAVFSFPILIGLLGLPIFFIDNSIGSSFFSWQIELSKYVYSSNLIHYLSAVSILYLSATHINKIVNVYGFHSKNTYLPGFIYVIILLSFNQVLFTMPIIAYGFLIYGIGFVFRINRQDSALSSVFLASVFFGVATVFEPLLLPIIILPWFALAIFRAFKWREWLASIIGFFIPWLYHLSLYYVVTGNVNVLVEKPFIKNWNFDFSISNISLTLFVLLLLLYSVWKFLVILKNELLIIKKRSTLLFNFILLGFISLFAGWFFYDELILTVAIPFSIIIAVQMLNTKHDVNTNIAVSIWLGLIVWNMFFSIY